MAEPLDRELLRDLVEEADAIGRLAKNEKSFTAAYKAFQSADRRAFQAVLKRLQLIPLCHRVCEWIRIKECVLVCLHLAGPPKPVGRAPNPRVLAEAIVRITSDEKLVQQLAQAVEKRDRAAFQRIVRTHELGPIAHLFCHWVCYVRYQLICRWVCDLELRERPDFVRELQIAGGALRALLERRKVFDEAVRASNAGDAEALRNVIQGAGLVQFCQYICFFFCSWRCVLVCLRLARRFPPERIKNPIEEALAFARETQALRDNPAALERLVGAVTTSDEKALGGVIQELQLQRFAIQLCHWICFLRCRRFCRLVCPPIFDHPWFTHVGDFDIYGDIDPASGLTNKSLGHGGPDFGFFGCLSLRGFCPKTSPGFPGASMAYRFLFKVGTTETPITGGFVCEVLVGSRYTFWNGNPFALQSVRIRGTGTTSPTPPPPGPGVSPPTHYIVPDAEGWVTVDPMALDDGFNGWLMGFASHVGVPGGDPGPAGLAAGDPVPAAARKNGVDAAIIFQATRVSTIGAVNGGAAPDYTNQLAKARINNWNEVRLLNLLQFHSGGGNACSPLTTDLDIEYTTDHELLAAWSIDLTTAAGVSLTAPPSGPTAAAPRGDAGTHHEDISAWPTCSYAVQLHTRRRLTDGLNDDPSKTSQVTFCIGRRERRPG